MDVIFATRNSSKLNQVREMFEGSGIQILSLDDAEIEGEADEDQDTLEGNALKKARYSSKHSRHGLWVMADDTGIFLNALHGLPGVRSARWAGDDATTADITAHTLRLMSGEVDRSAIFRTVVALVCPSGEEAVFSGEIRGKLLGAEVCKPHPRMPYSAIFMPNGHDKVLAQMSADEGNAISHRGIAFRQALHFLKNFI